MSRQFPPRPEITQPADRDSLVLELDDDAADEVFETLSSKTTRRVFVSLYEEPAPISQLAEEHETSIQNVQYHVEKLRDAGLIDVCGTWYSDQGTEMNVYAPTSESLVLFAGENDPKSTLQRALARLFGAIGLVGILSLLVQVVAERLRRPESSEPYVLSKSRSVELTAGASDATANRGPIAELLAFLTQALQEPGVLVFGIGLVALLFLFGLWYARRYRRPLQTLGGR